MDAQPRCTERTCAPARRSPIKHNPVFGAAPPPESQSSRNSRTRVATNASEYGFGNPDDEARDTIPDEIPRLSRHNSIVTPMQGPGRSHTMIEVDTAEYNEVDVDPHEEPDQVDVVQVTSTVKKKTSHFDEAALEKKNDRVFYLLSHSTQFAEDPALVRGCPLSGPREALF